jgi:hypothetical protein
VHLLHALQWYTYLLHVLLYCLVHWSSLGHLLGHPFLDIHQSCLAPLVELQLPPDYDPAAAGNCQHFLVLLPPSEAEDAEGGGEDADADEGSVGDGEVELEVVVDCHLLLLLLELLLLLHPAVVPQPAASLPLHPDFQYPPLHDYQIVVS